MDMDAACGPVACRQLGVSNGQEGRNSAWHPLLEIRRTLVRRTATVFLLPLILLSYGPRKETVQF